GLKLEPYECLGLAFLTGAACFSQIVFLLCSIGLARRNVFLAIGLLAAIAALCIRPNGADRQRTLSLSRIVRDWKMLPFLLLFPAFGALYLVNAMAPEMSPDGSAYHLPVIARYLQAHGFEQNPRNFYASLSQGIELLFLPAYAVGRHS